VKLKLDLHDIYNRGGEIERALRAITDEAVAKKAPLVETRRVGSWPCARRRNAAPGRLGCPGRVGVRR
jgi:hypothetical protein